MAFVPYAHLFTVLIDIYIKKIDLIDKLTQFFVAVVDR